MCVFENPALMSINLSNVCLQLHNDVAMHSRSWRMAVDCFDCSTVHARRTQDTCTATKGVELGRPTKLEIPKRCHSSQSVCQPASPCLYDTESTALTCTSSRKSFTWYSQYVCNNECNKNNEVFIYHFVSRCTLRYCIVRNELR